MPAKATSRRLSRLEAVKRRGAVVVCQCATKNGRVNLPDGEHIGDCPALDAGRRDVVLKVRYATRP